MFHPRASAAALLLLTSAAAAQTGEAAGPALRSTIDRPAGQAAPPPQASPATAATADNAPLSLTAPSRGKRTRRLRGAPVVKGNTDIYVDESGQLTTSYQP